MPNIAAGALLSALILLAASYVWTIVAFVCGWLFAIEPMLLSLVLGGALLIGLFGMVGFTLGLIVQTLFGRVHWRYLAALAVVVSLWFVPWALPPPYLAGMTASLQYHGLGDDALVAFARASRAENVPPAASGTRQLVPSTRAEHAPVRDTLPAYARFSSTPEFVEIRWGGALIGARGILIFDGNTPAEPLVGQSRNRRRISPHVVVYWEST